MSDFPQWETIWESQTTVSHSSYPSLRKYSGVHYGRNDRKVYVKEILPPVVKQTLGKKMNFNCFSGVMNFYFPGFGFKPMPAKVGGFFHNLIGTTFRHLKYHGTEREELKSGDLVIIKTGIAFDHAMVFLGNGMVWQKPNSEMPAGFYSMSDTIFHLTKGLPSSTYSIEYYRFDRGSSTDHYSQKILQDIQEGTTEHFFE